MANARYQNGQPSMTQNKQKSDKKAVPAHEREKNDSNTGIARQPEIAD